MESNSLISIHPEAPHRLGVPPFFLSFLIFVLFLDWKNRERFL